MERDGWEGGRLLINLAAIAENYARLCARVGSAECGAAVKANAYGLGLKNVGQTLYEAGCRTFFVAHLAEGAALRPLIGQDSRIFVLHGPPPGTANACLTHHLVPVLNSLQQVQEWQTLAHAQGRPLAAALQVDSGMSRFGLTEAEVDYLATQPQALAGIQVALVMSHLGCADTPDHPLNHQQLATFITLKNRLPAAPASLAASSGIFLGPDWHFDLVRPGAALYGIAPTAGQPNPLRATIRLQARVIQTRQVPAGACVGYGAAFTAQHQTPIALLGIGYGDGFPRRLGQRGFVICPDWPDIKLPIIGRISMDSLAVDLTPLLAAGAPPPPTGAVFDLIGPHMPLDEVAHLADTIGYELLTDLGTRYHRLHYDPRKG
ncbi:alanine racemase [Acetobacter orleanensis]|uniref:Alanine racemase n=1 Tax=Acetobacter orleanensis TaxID=104099 RepID=A0A4Y3TMW8_9PROT|nr:alanine racemase [Acetobacter orleanensis]KXV65230.1 alanine racemase [Acetobacter orleanensis]PCD79620.1 alanine racemase [Acetobacter orleanensis]GAN68716.1 alanine racemase [Acetobacter orleanensis JCM 7639]GBR24571.1 alanine racemase [Acetobacter orleanensis NRIC 0473]GEB82310.1 alanine racemase, catabolic [Acetobacter orleanensis]